LSELFIMAQAAQPALPGWVNFIPMALILVVFYFLLVAPMRKRQRELQQLVEKLQKGDKVVTNGGLHGEIAGIEGAVVLL
jgi:preprotein translocase subunit YajC